MKGCEENLDHVVEQAFCRFEKALDTAGYESFHVDLLALGRRDWEAVELEE